MTSSATLSPVVDTYSTACHSIRGDACGAWLQHPADLQALDTVVRVDRLRVSTPTFTPRPLAGLSVVASLFDDSEDGFVNSAAAMKGNAAAACTWRSARAARRPHRSLPRAPSSAAVPPRWRT